MEKKNAEFSLAWDLTILWRADQPTTRSELYHPNTPPPRIFFPPPKSGRLFPGNPPGTSPARSTLPLASSLPFTSIALMRPKSLPVPLLISSIGNPTTRYADTLHSAGHTILEAVQGIIGYPTFTPFLSGQKSALTHVSRRRLVFPFVREVEKSENEDDWTLWKSGSLMNVSGPAVAKVWERWRMEWEPRKRRGHLVVVHDELESGFGVVRIRDGWSSPRGHNGVKSIQTTLSKSKMPFTRICVGIGRPESRDTKVVSSYVLRKMTSKEKNILGESAHECMKIIRDITDGVI